VEGIGLGSGSGDSSRVHEGVLLIGEYGSRRSAVWVFKTCVYEFV